MAIREQKKNNSRVEKGNVMRNVRESVANRGSQEIYFLTVLNEGVNVWQLTCACVKKGVIVYDGQQFFGWSKKRWPFVVVKSIWCFYLPIATANMIDKVSARWNAHIFFLCMKSEVWRIMPLSKLSSFVVQICAKFVQGC